MLLTEGTCLCLSFGIIFLILVFKRFVTDLISASLRTSQVSQVAPPPSSASNSSPNDPKTTPEEEKRRLEAYMESLYRQEWLKQFEEEEIARRFQKKFYDQQVLHEVNEMQEAQRRLQNLVLRRQILEYQLKLTDELPNMQ